MTRKELEDLIYNTYGIRGDYPFEGDSETAVFRHTGTGKWFAIAMRIGENKLGKNGKGRVDVVNFKCSPEIIESIVGTEPGIYPAYHMNKMHWLTVQLSECDDRTVSWLLGISRDLTKTKEKRLVR